jgi:hypothetical protein
MCAESFELCEVVAAGEVEKRFFGVSLDGVGPKKSLHHWGEIGELDCGDELAS